jgi:2-polyprenyl-3-methyl-5-hydroxy-6-metoxy-1,4-benzoquinol methylase
MHATAVPPNPGRIHRALTSYQLPMALKGAIELDLFTHIAAGAATVPEIAARCGGSEKGVRVLCDYLTVHDFLVKAEGRYSVAGDVAPLLDRRSPSYMGSVAGYFTHPAMVRKYADVAALVRNGGATDHTLAPNDPIWVEFARRMGPFFAAPAQAVARLVATPGQPQRVLDVAAGHGLFGVAVALENPSATITFQDWDTVLEVARENAVARGLDGRFDTIAGSAFDVDFGGGFDLVLLPNFLHHFDRDANVTLLRKAHDALRPGARVAIVEFVPNEDRVSPPDGALFAMRMLGTTPGGDAYTLAELTGMLRASRFDEIVAHSLAPAPQTVMVAIRR